MLAKVLLFGTPISDHFGLISLLAGIRADGIKTLRGAALSGKLTKKMRIRFTAHGDGRQSDFDRLELEVGSRGKSGTLDASKRYG